LETHPEPVSGSLKNCQIANQSVNQYLTKI